MDIEKDPGITTTQLPCDAGLGTVHE
jgi:hypothetical protein